MYRTLQASEITKRYIEGKEVLNFKFTSSHIGLTSRSTRSQAMLRSFNERMAEKMIAQQHLVSAHNPADRNCRSERDFTRASAAADEI